MAGFTPSAGGTLIYFSCEDCGVEAFRVAAARGQVFREKFSIAPYGFIAIIIDTEGNMIGLHLNERLTKNTTGPRQSDGSISPRQAAAKRARSAFPRSRTGWCRRLSRW